MNPSSDLPIIPIGVKNAPFTLDLFARDCPATQFVREFTINGIEAIETYRERHDPAYHGEVVWTIDPNLAQLGLTKLSCIDTGIGMSGEEMPEYLNDLVSSGKQQCLDRNYGIGAKVSAAVGNPDGVVYASWQGGRGHMIALGRDDAGVWGMRQHRLRSENVSSVVPLTDEIKPPELRELNHGTIVTFLGESEDKDTTLPPAGERGDRWITKQLNQRFYELPEWVTVKVREIKVQGDRRLIRFRRVRGQRYFLDQHTFHSGSVAITGATVHWRILTDDHDDRAKHANVWASTGHRACLFQGELFELATAARGGYEKLKEFGIRFGYERVVIYVEPKTDGRTVTQDTVRTLVKIDGLPLPWDRYAGEFEANMPVELCAFQEEIAAGAQHRDHSAAVRERLAEIAELFDIPRYRPEPGGKSLIQEPNAGGAPGDREHAERERHGRPPARGGTGGNLYALFEDDRGNPAAEVAAQTLPEIKVDWVSVRDGTRTPPHLEDRAAAYDRRRNMLEVNADFRGYTDVLRRWERRYGGVAGAAIVIEATAAGWWQQALEETILGVLALRGSEHWNERTIAEALSEVSLTAAAMARYHLDAALKRELARRLGTLRAAA
jgi:hypothetical protein